MSTLQIKYQASRKKETFVFVTGWFKIKQQLFCLTAVVCNNGKHKYQSFV